MVLDLDEDLVNMLREWRQPVQQAARELIVMELYRLGKVSSGRAAELLGLPRLDFIQRAADLAIPYFRLTAEDLDKEMEAARSL
jgi:predicted HTH domain antitoxin